MAKRKRRTFTAAFKTEVVLEAPRHPLCLSIFWCSPPIIHVKYRPDDETYKPYRHGYKGNNRIKRFH